MKHFRLWLLLLIAFVLPLRGALAFGVACPNGGDTEPAVVHVQVMDDCHHGGETGGDKQFGQHQGHDAACCSAAVVMHEQPAMPGAVVCGAVVFAPLQAPPASFENEGPERPPRTI